ncbi:ATP-binding protein [Fulvivirga sp.]|uniref:AAA family ATPase n=1 Tax=Fulvivirga sp. TaxID=1931237 RepID=UPI0032ED9A04
MVAEPIRQRVKENTFDTEYRSLSLLKAGIIYGANASGKSNLFKGLSFMKSFVLESANSFVSSKLLTLEPYRLNKRNLTAPTYFEIEFIVFGERYNYSFSIDRKRVHSENLISILKTTSKTLFSRELDSIEVNPSFGEGFGKQKFARPDSLFLSTVGIFNGPISKQIMNWFENTNIITDNNIGTNTSLTAKLALDKKFKKTLLQLFEDAKLDIDDIEIETQSVDDNSLKYFTPELRDIVKQQTDYLLKIWTKHRSHEETKLGEELINFDLSEESSGTQKFFALAGPIVNSIRNGYPLFVDELDSRLHSELVKFILELFCRPENKNGGQLIAISHMPHILSSELLRTDQMIMLQRGIKGTTLKTVQSMGIRYDASFERDYLKGKYGGIPNIKMNQLGIFKNEDE